MPPYKAIYADWNVNTPDWAPSCASLARGRLDKAKAIDNERFGLQQFLIGEPIWGSDLTGKDAKPKVAIQKVWMPESLDEEELTELRDEDGRPGAPVVPLTDLARPRARPSWRSNGASSAARVCRHYPAVVDVVMQPRKC